LSKAEAHLLRLFGKLGRVRNEIMHGTISDLSDVTLSAMALLGVLRVASKRLGVETRE
jgi:hypothetical protein